jgi:hypothetical protein
VRRELLPIRLHARAPSPGVKPTNPSLLHILPVQDVKRKSLLIKNVKERKLLQNVNNPPQNIVD